MSTRADPLLPSPVGALRQLGRMTSLGASVLRAMFIFPFQFNEYMRQCWFFASVTIMPTAMIAIPFGAVIALQLGSLTTQIGAQSYTGAASAIAIVQQAAPLITVLIVAGAGGSAMCADIGARTIREEIDAMRVIGVDPVHRLIVPRVLAAVTVAILLNGLVSVVGVAGGYFFNVVLQGGTPGAYLQSFNSFAQIADLFVSEVKALMYGFVAGIVATYRGFNPSGGPKGVGDAVNQAVVITFLLLFLINVVVTAVYLKIVPPKGM
ncbi:MlaE family ABC transporter permease [Sciscionella marina]|uniref:MlaE family ABC transporter permease n=1 Tax=Sciscionella marina TaxID=508770 RepID=UPI00036CC516|nr:ABC transporter permease [Sciscionella marina]